MKVGVQSAVTFCVVAVLLAKSWLVPGWVSAVELIAGLALLAGRWFFEPKTNPASDEDVDAMKRAIENLGGQIKTVDGKIGSLALKIGLRPK